MKLPFLVFTLAQADAKTGFFGAVVAGRDVGWLLLIHTKMRGVTEGGLSCLGVDYVPTDATVP